MVSSVITIAGQGSTIVRDPAAPDFFRILAVHNTGDLTLQETTVSGGVSSARVNGDGTSYNGGGVANYGGTLTVMHSTIAGNAAAAYCNEFFCYGGSGVGGGVYSSGTVTITNSTITGNYDGGVFNGGTLTVTNSTIAGNSTLYGSSGGGVANGSDFSYFLPGGTVTILNSTISGNSTDFGSGGGVSNYGGTVTVTNSTISGNFSAYSGGGVHNDGTLTVTNSTIAGNHASRRGGEGGGVRNSGTLSLARTLVSGNTALSAPEIVSFSFFGAVVFANNHNLFGVDGTAGVEGFTPGATDIVPPAGVLLPDILDPTLAHNGGPTQTHALVPGSPAIDAGTPDCTDATGDPLVTDQRGQPRIVDGNSDGITACDIGAVEFFPVGNDFVTLAPDLDTAFNPTPVPGGPAGTFTITATFTNHSATSLRFPFFTVTELSGDNLLLNADDGTQGVGATLTPDVGDRVLAPGETVTVDFVIGLHTPERFTFFVDLFGEPVR